MAAAVLLVFGRGVVVDGGHYCLPAAGVARVKAAAEYVAGQEYATPPRIVFSGGWGEASTGAPAPPEGYREGDLMVRLARDQGLHEHAELRAETRSRSTLENLVHAAADGLLTGFTFSATSPLGLVTHAWHLPRVRYLAGKVLGLRGAALLDIPATGPDAAGPWFAPGAAHLSARLCFAGTRDSDRLLRRERRLVAGVRRAQRLMGLGRFE